MVGTHLNIIILVLSLGLIVSVLMPMHYTLFKTKLRIILKWHEMQSKLIFRQPKWPPAANIKVAY